MSDKVLTYGLNFLFGLLLFWSCIGFTLGFLLMDFLGMVMGGLGIALTSLWLFNFEVEDHE